jgi:hypothetical protein
VWKNGALLGSTPEQAFFIKCDETTMTASDIDNGRLICLIGVRHQDGPGSRRGASSRPSQLRDGLASLP